MTQQNDPQNNQQPQASPTQDNNPISPDDLKAMQQNAGSDALIDQVLQLLQQMQQRQEAFEKKFDDIALLIAEDNATLADMDQNGVLVKLQ